MSINRISYFCTICSRELNRYEIADKICGKCKAKEIANKIVKAVKTLEINSKTYDNQNS